VKTNRCRLETPDALSAATAQVYACLQAAVVRQRLVAGGQQVTCT
jgi:hypothetical protein